MALSPRLKGSKAAPPPGGTVEGFADVFLSSCESLDPPGVTSAARTRRPRAFPFRSKVPVTPGNLPLLWQPVVPRARVSRHVRVQTWRSARRRSGFMFWGLNVSWGSREDHRAHVCDCFERIHNTVKQVFIKKEEDEEEDKIWPALISLCVCVSPALLTAAGTGDLSMVKITPVQPVLSLPRFVRSVDSQSDSLCSWMHFKRSFFPF